VSGARTAHAGSPGYLSRACSSVRANPCVVEAAAAGIAYGAILCWASTCLVASFRGDSLPRPYRAAIPSLRTDTCGAVAFAVAAVSLTVSEYLRLQRRQTYNSPRQSGARPPWHMAAQAVSKTTAVLSTGLVAYISVNAVVRSVGGDSAETGA
jgi:hypothetical protein